MANTAFRIAELGPLTIKENLKNYLKSQSEFSDYNFEGSGLNIMLDILSYNTHYLAFYMNMLGAESFMDSAQLRNSIVSHAKMLGYTPRSMTPARALINVIVTPSSGENQSTTELTLPRWTRFVSQANDGINYPYVTIHSNTVVKQANSFTFSNIVVKQADVVSRSYVAGSGNPDRSYYIPSANVDIDEIYVSVQKSATNTYTQVYSKFNDLTELRSNSAVFFVEESTVANNNYRIFFGDGVIGKKPEDNEIITVTYITSDGEHGNGANSFMLVESIDGYDDNVVITTVQSSAGGSARESIETTRYRAPRYYTTQNRAVTTRDYETLITQDYPNIDSVSVWGGETENPPVYGKVFISLKPKDNYFITNLEKQQIIDEIIATRSIVTVIPEIVNPEYTWLLIKAKVYYDKAKTNMDSSQINALIRNAIINYSNQNLKKFTSKFRASKLQRELENSSDVINSTTIDLEIQKRIKPTYMVAKNYTIDFKKELEKDSLYTFPAFQIADSAGTIRDTFIEEVPQSYTGIDEIVVQNGGNGYEDATITITGDGTGATANVSFLNKKINKINIVNRGSNYTKATVTITSNTGFGAAATADLQFQNGILRTYYFKANGEKVVLNNAVGTINYRTGQLVLNNLIIRSVSDNDFYNDDVITVNAQPADPDISPIKNSILDIDVNDSRSIKITPIGE